MGKLIRKTKNQSSDKLFEDVKTEAFPNLEFLEVLELNNNTQKRLEIIRKNNEGFDLKRKLREIDGMYTRLLRDCKQKQEWQDLSIELLGNDKSNLIR